MAKYKGPQKKMWMRILVLMLVGVLLIAYVLMLFMR